MRQRTITIDAEIEVDTAEFEDDDLVEELEERGYIVTKLGGGAHIDATAAYLAVRDNASIPNPVREFVLAAANRIN